MQRIATDLLFRTSLLVGVLLTATTGVGQPVDVDKLRAKKEAAALTAPNENAPAAFQVTPGSQLIRVDPKPANGFIRVVRPDKGPQAWIPQDVVELAHKADKLPDEHQCAQSLADCPARGCEPEGTPDAIANALKRAVPPENSPVPLTFADFAALQRQADKHVGQGPPELSHDKRISLRDLDVAAGRISEHDRVRVIGFVAKGGKGLHVNATGESVNCMLKKPEQNDLHIPLVNDAKDLELQGIVVEMIPQQRPAAWTLDALTAVQENGKQVWVEGALFYDKVHYVEDDPDAPLKDEPERASLWEVHPITKFLVCRKDHCDPQTESEWTPLGAP